jgi:hypothetical protein
VGEGRTEGMVFRSQNDIGFYSFLAGVITGYPGPSLGNAFTQTVTCSNDFIKGLSPQ